MFSDRNKLIAYSALASSFMLFKNETNAQVIYTDIEPDIIIDTEVGFFFAAINMDNDGPTDFLFEHDRIYSIDSFFGLQKIQGIWIKNLSFPFVNSIAGSLLDALPYAQAYAINKDEIIDENMSFNVGADVLASRILSTFTPESEFNVVHYGGIWYPGKRDKYIGVRFKDLEDTYHYGWIRCTVKDKGRVLIIKDYAYEEMPEFPIKAGSDETYLPVLSEGAHTANLIYSSSGKIFINLGSDIITEASICIYNVLGKAVYRNTIDQRATIIDLNLNNGIYFVEVISDGHKYLSKIYLQ